MAKSQQNHKSRSGCITCKIRKVKCDESHPSCQRCSSTGRRCDGYGLARGRQFVAGYLVVRHVSEFVLPPEEFRALQYFQQVTTLSLLNLDSGTFWSNTVLQVCRQEECLRHLLLAVGILDEQQSSSRMIMSDSRYLHHYGKALKLLSRPQPETWPLLIASLLLCVFEDFRSRGFSALQHIISGRTILRAYYQGRLSSSDVHASTTRSMVQELMPIFSKLERQTWEFDPETLPPRESLSLADLCRREVSSESGSAREDPEKPDRSTNRYAVPTTLFSQKVTFQSLDHANDYLYLLRPRCIASRAMTHPPATRFHVVPSITHELNVWLDSLHKFVSTSSQNLSLEEVATIRTLRTLHLCLNIMSQTFPFHSEIVFDNHSHVLEHIIRTLPYSFDRVTIDLAPALWLGATKSRNSEYRRSAVNMLRRTDEKPGACFGRGEMLARAAEMVIKLEENGLGDVVSCSDVPEEHRIRVMSLNLKVKGEGVQEMTMWFGRSPYKDNALEKMTIDITNPDERRINFIQLDAVLAFDWKAT